MISRYIFKEFLQIFLITALSLAVIELSVDILERIRGLYAFNPSFYWLSQFFLARLLSNFFDTFPIALLLATLITFGGLAKSNEITAFKSLGISVFQLSVPLLIFGAVISFFSYQLTGGIIPRLYKKSREIRIVEIQKHRLSSGFVQNKTWLHLDRKRLIYVQVVSADKKRMQGVHLYALGDDFDIVEETEAAELVYEAESWILLKGTRRSFLANGQMTFQSFEREAIEINRKPEDFEEILLDLKEMGYQDLRDYIRQLQSGGFDATRYEVDLRGKEALPVVNFVMILLGIPFALKDNRSSGITRGIAISLAVALFYWLVFSVTLSLGRLGVLPSWLAAWSANLLITSIGTYLFLNIRQ